MSLKKLLGLETFPLSETEIMKKIDDAYQTSRDEIVFTFNSKKVTVRLSKISPLGMMTDYHDYFAQ